MNTAERTRRPRASAKHLRRRGFPLPIRFDKKNAPHTEENELWGLREENREDLKKAEDEDDES
jgi:hypothetical protein